jgi:hypothetical protein
MKNPHAVEYFTHLKIITMLTWAKEILHNHSDHYNDQLRTVPQLSLINIEKLQEDFNNDLSQGKSVSDYCSLIHYQPFPLFTLYFISLTDRSHLSY